MKCSKVLRYLLLENVFYYSRQMAVTFIEFASLYYIKNIAHRSIHRPVKMNKHTINKMPINEKHRQTV